MKIKRLFFDIEVSPNVGFFWNPGYNITLDYNNIIQERAIICVCYKWEDENKVYSLTWDKDKNDKELLSKLVKVMIDADQIVAHNGDRFDITWIRTRCLYHGIDIPHNFLSVDTLKAARSKFRFNSNRLDYIGKFLGLGQKSETGGFNLWKDITLKNNKKALKNMVEYCKNDVFLLESIFKKLNPYIKSTIHVSGEKEKCPECNSKKVHNHGLRTTAAGIKYIRKRCHDCGKWFQTKFKNDEKNS
jgi:DNA polymerase elongation subunit (family B)